MEEFSLPSSVSPVLSPQWLETWDKAKLLLHSEPWARTKPGASGRDNSHKEWGNLTQRWECWFRNKGKLKLINTDVRNQFVPFPTREASTDKPTRRIEMTFYFVKNTWKIKMKAFPGFANHHQNPWSHKDSVFKRCFLSPAPFSRNSLTVEWPTRVLRKRKKKQTHFEPTLEIIQDWFSAGAATLHLNKGTKFPLGICISISPNLGVLREKPEGRLSSVQLSSKNQRNWSDSK